MKQDNFDYDNVNPDAYLNCVVRTTRGLKMEIKQHEKRISENGSSSTLEFTPMQQRQSIIQEPEEERNLNSLMLSNLRLEKLNEDTIQEYESLQEIEQANQTAMTKELESSTAYLNEID